MFNEGGGNFPVNRFSGEKEKKLTGQDEVVDLRILHNHFSDFVKPEKLNSEPIRVNELPLPNEMIEDQGSPIIIEGPEPEEIAPFEAEALKKDNSKKAFFGLGEEKRERNSNGSLTPEGMKFFQKMQVLEDMHKRIVLLPPGEKRDRFISDFDNLAGFDTGLKNGGAINMGAVRAVIMGELSGPIYQGENGVIHFDSQPAEVVEEDHDLVHEFLGIKSEDLPSPEPIPDFAAKLRRLSREEDEATTEEALADSINLREAQEKINRQLIIARENERWESEQAEKAEKLKTEEDLNIDKLRSRISSDAYYAKKAKKRENEFIRKSLAESEEIEAIDTENKIAAIDRELAELEALNPETISNADVIAISNDKEKEWLAEQERLISEDKAIKREEMEDVRMRERLRVIESKRAAEAEKSRRKDLKDLYLGKAKLGDPVMSRYVEVNNRLDLMRSVLPRIKDAASEEERAEYIKRFNEIAGYDTGISQNWKDFSFSKLKEDRSKLKKLDLIPLLSKIKNAENEEERAGYIRRFDEIAGRDTGISKNWQNFSLKDLQWEKTEIDAMKHRLSLHKEILGGNQILRREEPEEESTDKTAPKLKIYTPRNEVREFAASLETQAVSDPEHRQLLKDLGKGRLERTWALKNIGLTEAKAMLEHLPDNWLDLQNAKDISKEALEAFLKVYNFGFGKKIILTGLETINGEKDLDEDTLKLLSALPLGRIFWPDNIKKQIDNYGEETILFEKSPEYVEERDEPLELAA